ncbi:MAG: hypothetical protein M3380_07785, partial [Chloroflexota bacterium]|nr:hypothetical protein [Chloroflexota bacterium]
MPRQRTVALTATQRQDLLDHRDHDPRPYVRERCAALLQPFQQFICAVKDTSDARPRAGTPAPPAAPDVRSDPTSYRR